MSKKILIVDDSNTVRMYYKILLKREGYELEEASNGREALERLEGYRPDLVLLDILMPEMDGVECCQRIKSNPDTKEIRVMMVTTKGQRDQAMRAYAAGCDDYLTKPINQDMLMTKIRTLLDDHQPMKK